jgi:hypothetical protein
VGGGGGEPADGQVGLFMGSAAPLQPGLEQPTPGEEDTVHEGDGEGQRVGIDGNLPVAPTECERGAQAVSPVASPAPGEGQSGV